MKIAILGFAGQGQSAYDYWNTSENEITICDKDAKIALPEGVQTQLGEDYLKNLDRFDLIVRTPALHPRDIIANNSPDIVNKITTVTNEFMRVCPSKNIIGVTGTKGKGTTSTLIAKILEAAGKRVHLGGNIGIPPLDMLNDPIEEDDWVVLELANFQLIDLKYSPHIAVCLMVVPEHLDWHSDMEEYVTAKQQLFRWQKSDDIAIYYRLSEHSSQVASISAGKMLSYEVPKPGVVPAEKNSAHVSDDVIYMNETQVCKASDVALLGRHNLENVCAAVAATWEIINHDVDAIREAVQHFTGMEHRLEFVREVGGIRYYDDSFGTTPETAIVAIQAFTQPKVVILGGSDKGIPFSTLAEVVTQSNVRGVVAIGVTGPAIAGELRKRGFTSISEGATTMDEIITAANAVAQPGDVVLLSTGCASFGLFQNYKDRGEQFKRVVQALPEPASPA